MPNLPADFDAFIRAVNAAQKRESMTQAVAEYLAASLSVPHSHDEYRARKLHGQWLVWCDASDSAVEFDQGTLDAAARAVDATQKRETAAKTFRVVNADLNLQVGKDFATFAEAVQCRNRWKTLFPDTRFTIR